MSTTLAITNEQTYWSSQQLSALKSLGLAQADSGDLAFFFHQAQRTGLDPFARQIYMINRGGRWGIQTSIDGFRIIAQRSGQYAGQTAPYWCGEDGQWVDVWLKTNPPVAAKIGVYRANFTEATWAVARWESYAVLNNPIWKKMPDVMLAKCAESLALRKAFPNDLSGIYTDEEMSQVDVIVEEKIKPKKIDLAIVTPEQPVEPIQEVRWLKLLTDIDSGKSKDAVKKLWNDNKMILDVIIPKALLQDTKHESAPITVREYLIEKVASLDA
jgi:phage recombination protein Bet